MSEIKTLQERLERKAAVELERDLKISTFMYANFKIIDMFNFVDRYILGSSKETIEEVLKFNDLQNEGKMLFNGGTHFIPNLMREIMFNRMLPAAIDTELKNVIEKLEKL